MRNLNTRSKTLLRKALFIIISAIIAAFSGSIPGSNDSLLYAQSKNSSGNSHTPKLFKSLKKMNGGAAGHLQYRVAINQSAFSRSTAGAFTANFPDQTARGTQDKEHTRSSSSRTGVLLNPKTSALIGAFQIFQHKTTINGDFTAGNKFYALKTAGKRVILTETVSQKASPAGSSAYTGAFVYNATDVSAGLPPPAGRPIFRLNKLDQVLGVYNHATTTAVPYFGTNYDAAYLWSNGNIVNLDYNLGIHMAPVEAVSLSANGNVLLSGSSVYEPNKGSVNIVMWHSKAADPYISVNINDALAPQGLTAPNLQVIDSSVQALGFVGKNNLLNYNAATGLFGSAPKFDYFDQIRDSGHVVGRTGTESGPQVVSIYHEDFGTAQVAASNGVFSSVAINDGGTVALTDTYPSNAIYLRHKNAGSFTWETGPKLRSPTSAEYSCAAAPQCESKDVNNYDEILITCRCNGANPQFFVYSSALGYSNIFTHISPAVAGKISSIEAIYAINDAGKIVVQARLLGGKLNTFLLAPVVTGPLPTPTPAPTATAIGTPVIGTPTATPSPTATPKPGQDAACDLAAMQQAFNATGSINLLGDLNHDGIVNGQDIALTSSNWMGKGAGDTNGDGIVNGQDIAILSAQNGARLKFDATHDGFFNLSDINYVAAHPGATCPH